MANHAVLVLIVAIGAALLLALIPGAIARSKGHSFLGFYFFGLFFFLPALIVALVIRQDNVRTGDVVKLRKMVNLNNGDRLPAGWASKALDVDVINGTPVVQIVGPTGSLHWVDKKRLKTA
jgi:hypothetical protein